MIKQLKANPRTTTFGGVTITGAIWMLLQGVAAQLDSNPDTVANWNLIFPTIITAVGASWGLYFAGDG